MNEPNILDWLSDKLSPAELNEIKNILEFLRKVGDISRWLTDIQAVQISLLYYRTRFSEITRKYQTESDAIYQRAFSKAKESNKFHPLSDSACNNIASANPEWVEAKKRYDDAKLVSDFFHELYMISLNKQRSLEQLSNNMRASIKVESLN